MTRYNFDESCTTLLGLALNASADEAIKVLINSGIDSNMMFSPLQTAVFNAMISCLRANQLPNEHFVMMMDSSIPKKYIDELRKVWTATTTENTLDIVAPIIKECYIQRRYWETLQKAQNLPYEESLESMLNVISSDSSVQFEEYLPSNVFNEVSGAGTPITLGIPWMDNHVPAYSSRFWAVLGGFKQRKTTLLRNIVLHSLMQNEYPPIIAYLAAENTRAITSADFLAMVYTLILDGDVKLQRQITYRFEDQDGSTKVIKATAGHFSNAENMLNLLKRIRDGKAEVESVVTDAISSAKRIFMNIIDPNLKIFDMTIAGGKANTLTGCMESVAKTHMLSRRDKQKMIISLDYLQLVSAPQFGKEKLNQMTGIVQWGLDSCGEYDALTIFLAQLNSSSDRKGTARDDVHVDYAPDLPRSVMAAYATRYSADSPTKLEVSLVAARREAVGLKKDFKIDPVSGVILNEDN